MLLRRITKHVKQQDWFAVVLDVLVVITGIFLGMQVAEWNDNRKDRIDGQEYLVRLHSEIIAAEQTSSRVRERRLNLIAPLTDAVTVIFSKSDAKQLTNDHCFALATSHYYNIMISDLPALTELMSAGRIDIIADHQLQTALVTFQQHLGTLKENTRHAFTLGHNLGANYPSLIRAEPYFDENLGEMQSRYRCDLNKMRSNQAFLNAASENVDVFDAYLRDGLRPWSDHMTYLHTILDNSLDIRHTNTE